MPHIRNLIDTAGKYMAQIIDFQSKDEQNFKQYVEMAVSYTVDKYIDKGRIADNYRNELNKEIFSKVQKFARQFLENVSYSVPYFPSGEKATDEKSKALATMTSDELGKVFLTLFVQSLSMAVDLEIQLWIKDKDLTEVRTTLSD